MGGLIQDSVTTIEDTIPACSTGSRCSGDALSSARILNQKTELVIFLRPLVIRDPSIDGDYRGYRVFRRARISSPSPIRASGPRLPVDAG